MNEKYKIVPVCKCNKGFWLNTNKPFCLGCGNPINIRSIIDKYEEDKKNG